jgi:hypothetical protein
LLLALLYLQPGVRLQNASLLLNCVQFTLQAKRQSPSAPTAPRITYSTVGDEVLGLAVVVGTCVGTGAGVGTGALVGTGRWGGLPTHVGSWTHLRMPAILVFHKQPFQLMQLGGGGRARGAGG